MAEREGMGGGSGKMGSVAREFGWEGPLEARRRTEPNFRPLATQVVDADVEFGTSLSTHSHRHHSQPQQTSYSHSIDYYPHDTHPTPPLQRAPQQFVDASSPSFPQAQQSPLQLSQHQATFPTIGYSLFTNPTPLHPYVSTQSLERPSLLFDQFDASSFIFNPSPSQPSPSLHHHHDPNPQLLHQLPPKASAFPSVWAPTSNSSLGISPRPVLFAGSSTRHDASTSTRGPQKQQVWGQGGWEEFDTGGR